MHLPTLLFATLTLTTGTFALTTPPDMPVTSLERRGGCHREQDACWDIINRIDKNFTECWKRLCKEDSMCKPLSSM